METTITKLQVDIKDTNIAHDLSTSPEKAPANFDWHRDDSDCNEYTFVTDTELYKWEDKNAIAWIIEPPTVSPAIYHYIAKNNNKFKYVLTFAKELISKGENFLFYPFGGSRLKKQQCQLYPKNKLTSIILSDKQFTVGHKFRHACKNATSGNVDVFIPANGVYAEKIDSCKDYMFSIVVENGSFDAYFSEKLIDCLLTGVVPIYNGCPSIGDYFNLDGIITFNNTEKLKRLVSDLTIDDYTKRKDAILENYNKAKEYFIAEDWIYNNYGYLFSNNNSS